MKACSPHFHGCPLSVILHAQGLDVFLWWYKIRCRAVKQNDKMNWKSHSSLTTSLHLSDWHSGFPLRPPPKCPLTWKNPCCISRVGHCLTSSHQETLAVTAYCSLMFGPRPPTHGKIQEAQYLGGQNGKKYRSLMRMQETWVRHEQHPDYCEQHTIWAISA